MTSSASDMSSLGFRPADSTAPPRRLIASISGLEKSGKTDLALTAPGPILFINVDKGTEGVVHKFASKDIWVYDVQKPPEGAGMAEWLPVYQELEKMLKRAFTYNEGTVVVDSHTEVYAIHRMARFGKLTQIMPHKYTELNAENRALLRLAYDSDMSAVFLHRLKKRYVNDNWDGISYDRDGYTSLEYDVQVNARTLATPSPTGMGMDFSLQVLDCRQNPNIVGNYQRAIPGPEGNIPVFDFNTLLSMVHK